MSEVTYYKVLVRGRRSCHGGTADWEKGVWMPPITGELIPCKNGYHLCRRGDLIHWLHDEIWEAEGRGEMEEAENKVVVREARITRKLTRWTRKNKRLFAADCAEHVLHLFESRYPDDPRPREAIQAARAYAVGKIGKKELAAAWFAAWDAAGSAAWSAAEAERELQTNRLFHYLDREVEG